MPSSASVAAALQLFLIRASLGILPIFWSLGPLKQYFLELLVVFKISLVKVGDSGEPWCSF